MVIDFRVRPPYRSFCNLTIFNARLNTTDRPAAWVGPLAESVASRSFDMFIEELNEAEVRHAVVWGRGVPDPNASTTLDDVLKLVELHPKLFSGLAGLAVPTDKTVESAVRTLEQVMLEFKLKGITLEPGFAMSETRGADDPVLLPLYERCQELDA